MTWLTNWNYRKAITISNTGSTLTDYQVSITIDTASLVTATKMRSDCGDIRFTSPDGSTLLNYWIESGVNTSSTKIWVKIPSIASGTNIIYLYYNNQTATYNNSSGGTNTFVYYEDFESYTADTLISNIPNWSLQSGTGYIKTDYPYAGTKCLRMTGVNVPNNGLARYTFPTAINYDITIEINSRTDKSFTDQWSYDYVRFGDSLITQGYFYNRNNEPGHGNSISHTNLYFGGGGIVFYQPYTLSTYEKYRMDVLYSTSKVNFYVNGVSKATNANFVNPATSLIYIDFGAYYAYGGTGANLWIDDIKIRKYAATEPTFSTTGSEELGITAYSMSLHPSETPCRTGICTVRADVTWQNLGGSSVTFRPKILIDGATYVQAASDTTIVGAYPATSSLIQITTPTLSAGTHSICPYPN